jgi:hypothetical protein
MLCHETVRQTDRAADRPTDSRVGAEKKRADIAYTHSGSQSRNYHVQPSADIDSETALGKRGDGGRVFNPRSKAGASHSFVYKINHRMSLSSCAVKLKNLYKEAGLCFL